MLGLHLLQPTAAPSVSFRASTELLETRALSSADLLPFCPYHNRLLYHHLSTVLSQ